MSAAPPTPPKQTSTPPHSDSSHSRRVASFSSSSFGKGSHGLGAWLQKVAQLPLTPITLCVLCSLGIVQTAYHMGNGVYRSLTWGKETREIQAENAALRRDIDILQEAKVQLNSPEYLQQVARCWGYVGQNEKVLVDGSAAASSAATLNIGSTCDEYRLP